MTRSEVFFDTWAWFEVLNNTQRGRRLNARYLGARIHTSVLSLAEISARLHAAGHTERMQSVASIVESKSVIHPISRDVALAAGVLRERLRESDPSAGLVDSLILASARSVGATLISSDPAFEREPDVRDS